MCLQAVICDSPAAIRWHARSMNHNISRALCDPEELIEEDQIIDALGLERRDSPGPSMIMR